MKSVWKLRDAKTRFSEVVNEALHQGPQTITRHGHEVVIVVSAKEYRKHTRPKNSFVEFMRKSPLRGVKLDLRRDRSLARDIHL